MRSIAMCLISTGFLLCAVRVAGAATVSTLAGNGTAGNVDGPALTAEFSAPAGIAIEHDGSIVIVDKSLNTVRELRGGVVTTIAGTVPAGAQLWAPGGYADGPAATAKFDHPEGIAVGPDGSVFVADTNNECIRRLKSGIVTTYAGSAGAYGNADGPAKTATFSHPVALAADARGDLFVADFQNAVREISADGMVTTLPTGADRRVTGIAYAAGPNGATLFVADVTGLIRYDLGSKTATRVHSGDRVDLNTELEGGDDLGFPRALAAVNAREVAFTDARRNTVSVLNGSYVHVVAGAAAHDAQNAAGGRENGAGDSARFFDPIGIARTSEGTLIVADAGSHRIRSLTPFDDRAPPQPADAAATLEGAVAGNEPRIAFVGNSFAWTDTTWDESIPGILQAGIDRGTPARHDRVLPFVLAGSPFESIASFVREELGDGQVRAVVLTYNLAFVDQYGGRTLDAAIADPAWLPAHRDLLAALQRDLGAHGVRLIVELAPYGTEFAPAESDGWQTNVPRNTEQVYPQCAKLHERMVEMLRASGVPYVDAWDAFATAAVRGEGPLYGTLDPHFTALGRKLMAMTLLQALPRIDPVDFASSSALQTSPTATTDAELAERAARVR